jgi:hypothetical protein
MFINSVGSGPFEGLFHWRVYWTLDASLRAASTPSLDGKSTAPTDAGRGLEKAPGHSDTWEAKIAKFRLVIPLSLLRNFNRL